MLHRALLREAPLGCYTHMGAYTLYNINIKSQELFLFFYLEIWRCNRTKRPSSELPQTRDYCYSVRIFAFVRLRLNCLVPKQRSVRVNYSESAACIAVNKTVHDLVDFLMINLRKSIDFSANYVIMIVRLSGVLWHITQH